MIKKGSFAIIAGPTDYFWRRNFFQKFWSRAYECTYCQLYVNLPVLTEAKILRELVEIKVESCSFSFISAEIVYSSSQPYFQCLCVDPGS